MTPTYTLSTLLILLSTLTFTTNSTTLSTIYDVLESKGLPSGLFPKGVTNFTIDERDGSFKVYLDQPCDAKFESELHYDMNVSGQLSFGQIGNLSGIEAQDLFLWFPVKGIRVDVPSSGVIYFDVGVVHKQFSVSLFETPRDCLASPHFNHLFFQKLGGVLRYAVNWWWKNEEELF